MKKFLGLKTAFGMLLVAGLMVGNASAETIIVPTAANLVGESGGFAGGTIQDGGIGWVNGAGLATPIAAGTTFDTSDVAASLAALPQHAYGNNGVNGGRIRKSSPFDPLPSVIFSLDGPNDLTGLILWNHGEGGPTASESDRGWSSATLSFTTAADPLDAGAVFTGSEALTFTKGPQGGANLAFIIAPEFDAFSTTFAGVTGVRFNNIDTFAGAPATGNHLLNVSEIRFTGTASAVAIPEPSSLALLSCIGVGVAARRRKRTA